MQKRGLDWSNRSGKISKNNEIIGYTRFRGNKYEIGNEKNGGLVVAAFASDQATPRNSRP